MQVRLEVVKLTNTVSLSTTTPVPVLRSSRVWGLRFRV